MIPDLQRVLEPAYVAGLAQTPIDRLRVMRTECSDLENGLSYIRRLAQGRLDVLTAETARRAEGGGGDLGDLVARLPELLSSGEGVGGPGRVDQDLDPPDEVVVPLTEVLDDVVGPSIMTEVADLDDGGLAGALTALRDFEEQLSTSRRSLHQTIDSLNDELARRLSDGEVPPAPT